MMSERRKISSIVQTQVRKRANALCEYCHTDERWQYIRFTIDHVLPLTQGGENTPGNLALACFHCNRRKSTRVVALDPQTRTFVALFNPRQHIWAEHFIWSQDGLRIVPRTAIGRATITLLDLNRDRAVRIRAADVQVGRHPPPGDPILED